MAKLTFFQKIGLSSRPQRGRKAVESKFYFGDIRKIGGLVREKKQKVYPYTKREKKITLATVGGAGAGFVVGSFTGGVGGFLLGVPIGTFTGNILARKRLPQKGRKSPVKFSLVKQWTTPRDELIRERKNILAIERARLKSLKTTRLFGKRRK